mgnify:CR=1 FL=1
MAVRTLGTSKSNGSKRDVRDLTKLDRCDAGGCDAQAFVLVSGVSGELTFCGHHYTSIMNGDRGKEAMEAFAFNTVDEIDKI